MILIFVDKFVPLWRYFEVIDAHKGSQRDIHLSASCLSMFLVGMVGAVQDLSR